MLGNMREFSQPDFPSPHSNTPFFFFDSIHKCIEIQLPHSHFWAAFPHGGRVFPQSSRLPQPCILFLMTLGTRAFRGTEEKEYDHYEHLLSVKGFTCLSAFIGFT